MMNIIIIGGGGHAVSVANVAINVGYDVKCFIDPARASEKIFGVEILPELPENINFEQINLALAIGNNFNRERIYYELKTKFNNLNFPILCHQSAQIHINSNVGEGSVIMPNAFVGPNSQVGRFCIINSKASIDHDCTMQDFSSIAPAVTTGGAVKIGERSFVGIGTIIKDRIVIGNDTVIGACSYVNNNTGDNFLCYGIPAKIIKPRRNDDGY